MYEIERKYLTRNTSWQSKTEPGLSIRQGYLSTQIERTVRVRTIGQQAWLTIKGKTEHTTRLEFEYEIPVEEAHQLLEICEKPLLEKTRYLLKIDKHTWEIDVFEGENSGLTVAEIELSDESESIDLPDWVGEEVSHDPRYYNANLVKHPFKEWE